MDSMWKYWCERNVKEDVCKGLLWTNLMIPSIENRHTARKIIFSFSGRPEKMVFPKKLHRNMIFLVLLGKMIFIFPENMILHVRYDLTRKWKVIFLKKHTKIWYFIQAFWKDGLSKRGRVDTWSFLYYLKRWYFFPENMIFFLWAGSERRSFSGNTWKHDALPSEEKQKTWYIGPKCGLSLNLFGWRYSAMNNLQ